MKIIHHFLSKKYEIYYEPTKTFDLDRKQQRNFQSFLFEGVEGKFLRCHII